MKYILIIIVIVTASCSYFKPKDPFDNISHIMGYELPDKSVQKWVRLSYLGTINHPPTVIFISPKKFKEFHDGPYEFSFISKEEYSSLLTFISKNTCLTEAPKTLNGESYLVIREHNGTKRNYICYTPGVNANKFFKELYELSEINWSKESLQSLLYLNNEFP